MRNTMLDGIRINPNRLWDSIMSMAKIGATEKGGSCRVALSDEDKAGRDLFVEWCIQAGCGVTVDTMGNIFARRKGEDETLPAVASGSHLDTQPHGGKFDGIFGVLAGLEVIRTLNEQGIKTRAPVDVAVWTNEEGVRFAPAMLASAVFAGVFDLDYGLSRADVEGRTVGAELARIGYGGTEQCGDRRFGAFFEAHIEQGPILEREGKTIGVVLGGQGCRWYDVTVSGQDAHAGSTPMEGRRDALIAAAEMAIALRQVALGHPPHAVCTVGEIHVSPNSRNTIPGQVRFTVDIRHADAEILDTIGREATARCQELARQQCVTMEIEEIWHQPPVHFEQGCISAVRAAARSLGIAHRDIVSGAGHDSFLISKVAPTSMIFVPCAGGISHNEEESATKEDVAAGCDVLLRAILDRAGVCAEGDNG